MVQVRIQGPSGLRGRAGRRLSRCEPQGESGCARDWQETWADSSMVPILGMWVLPCRAGFSPALCRMALRLYPVCSQQLWGVLQCLDMPQDPGTKCPLLDGSWLELCLEHVQCHLMLTLMHSPTYADHPIASGHDLEALGHGTHEAHKSVYGHGSCCREGPPLGWGTAGVSDKARPLIN